jgi:hypothetical protein
MPIPTFPRHDYDEDQYILKPAGLRDTHSDGKVSSPIGIDLHLALSSLVRGPADKSRLEVRGHLVEPVAWLHIPLLRDIHYRLDLYRRLTVGGGSLY